MLLLFAAVLLGGSLAVLFLFNLPLFYELETVGFGAAFLITWAIFTLLIISSRKVLLLPLAHFREKNKSSIVFVFLLGLLLAGTFYFTQSYYWSIPRIHSLVICFESNDPAGTLELLMARDRKIGREYPAEMFGHRQYPISIASGSCITTYIRTVQDWTGVTLDVGKTDPGNLITTINKTETVFPLVGNDGISQESIFAFSGSRGITPIYPELFSGLALTSIKWVALLLSSFYLAFFVFGLVELILSSQDKRIISHKTALLVVLVYFLIFGFVMANHGGQPDQRKHIYYSARFSETWGIPEDDPQSDFHIKGHEYLSYWIYGAAAKLYRLVDPDSNFLNDKLLWRLMSVVMSAGTLFYVYKLTSRVTGNRFGGVLAAFFLANTLMFVFVSGGISYDNMMSLSSAAALYHLVSILKKDDYVKHTALLGSWLGLGALAKDQVALLAFILFIVWLFYSIKNAKSLKFQFSYPNIVLIVILVISVGMFLEFYGGNLIKYQRPKPKCEQTKPAEVCTRFKDRDSQRQEVNYENLWAERNTIVGPFEYALNRWFFNMINGIWGVVSFNTYEPKFTTSFHGLLIVWAIFCLVRYWKKEDPVPLVLALVILSYIGYVFIFNYNNLLRFNFLYNYAVQGRYLFPVFGAFLAIMVNAFLSIHSLWLRRITISLAIVLYFAGGLGTFVFRYSDVFIGWRIFY